jgi:hypothetical protein
VEEEAKEDIGGDELRELGGTDELKHNRQIAEI